MRQRTRSASTLRSRCRCVVHQVAPGTIVHAHLRALQSLSITVTGLMMFVFRRRNALAHDAGRVFESTAGFTYTL